MADQSYKVQVDYKNPDNVEAEVPGSQELREFDEGTVSHGTLAATDDFTLSPVITVTKKESTFTKGDLKLQKVTVSEDIAIEGTQNGSQSSRITRKYTSSVVSDGKTITRSASSSESKQEGGKDDKHHDVKKSRIPMLKFRQTVEKVKQQRRSKQKEDEEVEKRPRKSSIPRLKGSKIRINTDVLTKKNTLAAEDEFEQLYGEIVNDEQQNFDDKVLAVKVEDPEKLESKFEELIHSYEENDEDIYTGRIRISKIPGLRRRKADEGAKLSSIVNNIRLQSAVRKSREFTNEDEFGEITTKTITTKRYGRGQSRDDDNMSVEICTYDDDTKESIEGKVIKNTGGISKVTYTESVSVTDDKNPGDVSKKVIRTTRVIKAGNVSSPTQSKHMANVTITDNADNTNADHSSDLKKVSKTQTIVTKSTNVIPELTHVKDVKDIIADTSESSIQEFDQDEFNVTETNISSPVITKVTTISKVGTKDNNSDKTKTEVIKTQRVVKSSSETPIKMITNLVTPDNFDSNQGSSKTIITRNIVRESSVEAPTVTQVTKFDRNDSYVDINQGVTTTEVIKTMKIIRESSVNIPAENNVLTTTRPDNVDNNNEGKMEIVTSAVTTKIDTNIDKSNKISRDTPKVTETSKITPKQKEVIRNEASSSIPINKTVNNNREHFVRQTSASYNVTIAANIINNDGEDERNNNIDQNTKVINKPPSIKIEKTIKPSKKLIQTPSQENVQNVKVNKLIEWKGSQTIPANKSEVTNITNTTFDEVSFGNQDDTKKNVTVTTVTKTWTDINSDSNNTALENKETIKNNMTFNTQVTKITADIKNVLPIDKSIEKLSDNQIINNFVVTNVDTGINKQISKTTTTPTPDTDNTGGITNITNQKEPKDINVGLQGQDKDIDITTLKGNVSRLINRIGSREDHDISTNNDVAVNVNYQNNDEHQQIDAINQERVRRLDKMISDFDKVDYKTIDTKIVNRKETEDSVVYTQDQDREEVTILKGNVNRLISKLGMKENNTITSRGTTLDSPKGNYQNTIELDIKFDSKVNKYQDNGNLKQFQDSAERTVAKKEASGSVMLENQNTVYDKPPLTHTENDANKSIQCFDTKPISLEAPKKKEADACNLIKEGDIISFNKAGLNNMKHLEDIKNTNAVTTITNTKVTRNISQENTYDVVKTVFKKEIVDNTTEVTEKDSNAKFDSKEIIGSIVTQDNQTGKKNTISKEVADSIPILQDKIEDEFPKKKSVLSKIAIFERLEPKESYPKPRMPRSENKLSKLVAEDVHIEKPRIVNEVRKDTYQFSDNNQGKIAVGSVNQTVKESTLRDKRKFDLSYGNNKDRFSDTVVTQTIRNPIPTDHAELKLSGDSNRDKITVIGSETVISREPVIVNEVWKTTLSEDGKVKNVSVTQTVLETNIDEYRNVLSIHDKVPHPSSYPDDNKDDFSCVKANQNTNDFKEIDAENVRANKYFITNEDNAKNPSTTNNITVTENPIDIYEKVKNRYNKYEQNAITISKELRRTQSKDIQLNMHTINDENSLTTAEITDIKFEYPRTTDDSNSIEFDGLRPSTLKTDSEKGHTILLDEDFDSERLISKEDYKRAQSLAETDLGDVVKGQVNRIAVRMRSVDAHRTDAVKTEKINIKEMPQRRSVWEKIALFEGKAEQARMKTTVVRTSTTKRCTYQRWPEEGKAVLLRNEITTEKAPKVTKTVTQTWSEEVYQQKIAELENAHSVYGIVKDVPKLTLADGTEMPVLALGTALLDPRLAPHVVGAAIALGYRAIDTAFIYGNEKEVGNAIRAKINDGTVKREDLYIISKLWSTFHRPDLVEAACRSSLEALGLEYFDLYLIHNPMSFKEGGDPFPRIATVLQYSECDYLDAWRGMEKLLAKGLVRSIGVSNFNSSQIQRLMDKGRVKPVVNQVECHPYLSQQRLHDFCSARNITLSCFGVLGSKGTPAEHKSSLVPAIDDPLVQVMAQGLNVTAAQLLIRFQLQYDRNVVVKASSAAHLWDNLQALNVTLAPGQADAIHALNKNKRTFTFAGMGDTHRNYPFLAPF